MQLLDSCLLESLNEESVILTAYHSMSNLVKHQTGQLESLSSMPLSLQFQLPGSFQIPLTVEDFTQVPKPLLKAS